MERRAVAKVPKMPTGNVHPQRQSARSTSARNPLLELQRTVGNQAIRRLTSSPFIQAKLQISTPEDESEQEADRVADTVMRMPKASVSRQAMVQPVSSHITPLAQRETDRRDKEEELVAAKSKLPIPVPVREDDEEEKPLIQRACDGCEEEKQHDQVASVDMVHRDPRAQTAAPKATTSVAASIHAMNGGGSPLSTTTRAFFEPRFGVDFSHVRVHTDSLAAATANAISASAFTTGHNIAFGPGRYAPHSHEGQQLLAHELTHVVQQSRADGMNGGRINEERRPYTNSSHLPAGSAAVTRLAAGSGEGSTTASGLLMRQHDPMQADLQSPFAVPRPIIQLPPLDEGKREAHPLLDDLAGNLEDFAAAERRWLSGNWIDYISRTSPNPRLSWSADITYGAVSNSLGNAASLSVETYLRRGATKAAAGVSGAVIGGAVGNAPGAAFGFVLGVIIETAVGFLLDRISGKASAEERAAAETAMKTGKLIAAQEAALDAKEDAGKAAVRRRIREMRANLQAAMTPEEVYAIRSDAFESSTNAQNKPARDHLQLMESMLREWVLEHAGDEEDANKETNEAQWEAARTRAFGKGDSLDKHPEIFAFQSRAHWTALGFPGEAVAAPMIDQVRKWGVNSMWPQWKGTRGTAIKEAFDDKTFEFTATKNPDAVIALLERHERRLTDEGKRAIRENRFRMTAKLDLEEDDGSVYVDNWSYTFTFLGGEPMTQWWERATGRSLGAGAILSAKSREATVEFDVSPD